MNSFLLFICLFCIHWSGAYSQYGIDDPSSASILPSSFHSLSRSQDTYDYVVVYRGFCYSSSGYGQEARTYIKGLLALGVPLYLDPQEQQLKVPSLSDDENAMFRRLEINDFEKFAKEKRAENKIVVVIHHTAPDIIKTVDWADINIARTMWEMDKISPSWVPTLNQFDEIWVPSVFNKISFSAPGIPESNLWVIGECMDEGHYSQEAIRSEKQMEIQGKRKLNFFSLFNWNYRKGWDVLVSAFAREFPPSSEVTLFIKTFSSWGRKAKEFREDVVKVLKAEGIASAFPANIILLSTSYKESDMPYLYKAFDVFVLPTRAEGWGRTTMEAMISGLPVVTTKYSGQEEFVTSRNSFVIPHTIVDVSPAAVAEVPMFEGGKWAEPSTRKLQKILRQLAKSMKEAKKKAKIAQTNVLENFTCSKITAKMRDRLDQIVSTFRSKK